MDAEIVDLADIAAACGPLAGWWDAFVATGEPRLPELERARRSLRRIASVPGPIGRAVRQLDIIGDEPAPGALIDAVELLCRVARRVVSTPKPTRPLRPDHRKRTRSKASATAQLPLPGFEAS